MGFLSVKKYRLVSLFVLLCVLFNLGNSLDYLSHIDSWKVQLYFVLNLIGVLLFIFVVVKDLKSEESIIKWFANKLLHLPIPKGAKIATIVVLAGNLFYMTIGKPNYPFYDVGMFRWATTFEDAPKAVHLPKYYYWKNDEPQIVEIRKQHIFFMADLWGWGYNNELTFSMNYHYKGHRENFEFISSHLKPLGIDTLWVGIHSVNYETREVNFDPDICRAISVNDTSDIYYGSIYIPEYQRERC